MVTGTVGPVATAQNELLFASAGPQILVFPATVIKTRDPPGTMPVAIAGSINSQAVNA
jgi:hypothetical protein